MELTLIPIQAYSPGAGVVPFLYCSEIFPQVLRGRPDPLAFCQEPSSTDNTKIEVGMAWASAVVWMGAGILDLCVPTLIVSIKPTRLLCLFA